MPHKPILSRPLDLLYLIFFLTHVPVMLCVDLTPLYPAFVHASLPFLGRIRAWYVATYRDRFFVAPPGWFRMFIWMEAGMHVPLSLWMVGALVRGMCFLALLIVRVVRMWDGACLEGGMEVCCAGL